jgi:hypothetical protein
MDKTLKRKGRLFEGYPLGTSPITSGLSFNQSKRNSPLLSTIDGADG